MRSNTSEDDALVCGACMHAVIAQCQAARACGAERGGWWQGMAGRLDCWIVDPDVSNRRASNASPPRPPPPQGPTTQSIVPHASPLHPPRTPLLFHTHGGARARPGQRRQRRKRTSKVRGHVGLAEILHASVPEGRRQHGFQVLLIVEPPQAILQGPAEVLLALEEAGEALPCRGCLFKSNDTSRGGGERTGLRRGWGVSGGGGGGTRYTGTRDKAADFDACVEQGGGRRRLYRQSFCRSRLDVFSKWVP